MKTHPLAAKFEIYQRSTGRVVGHAKTREGARRSVDRRDNAYGSYAFSYREVGSDRPCF